MFMIIKNILKNETCVLQNYDKKIESPRKMLLPFNGVTSAFPSKTKAQHQQSLVVVQPQNDDIYLCDNCDAELIGFDQMKVLVTINICIYISTIHFCVVRTLLLINEYCRNTKGYAVNKNRVAVIRGLLRRMSYAFNRKWNKINF